MDTNSTPPNSIAKIGKILLMAALAVVVSYIFLFPQLFYSQSIGFSAFRSGGDRFFVSPEILESQDSLLRAMVRGAQVRVDSFYTGLSSKPTFIICSTPVEYERYCSGTEGAGCSLGTPWGESFVVVNLMGANVDVISHELSHIELLERLGWWETTFNIPQWFNEGVALMLDRRFVDNPDPVGRYMAYNDEWLVYSGGQMILELREIQSMKAFFSGSERRVMLAYMTSGMEISYWLAAIGKGGLAKFLRLVDSGLSFQQAYHKVEEINGSVSSSRLPLNPLRVE